MRTNAARSLTFFDRLADAGLWLVAALHMLAALSLIALLALAGHARAEDLSCGGHNILTGLKTSDPKGYQEIEEKAAKLENSQTVFWRVEKAGAQPSWLLGTMHLSDPRVLNLPAGAEKDFQAAQTVIVESDEIADKQKAASALLSRPDLAMFSGNDTIYNYISDDQKALLEKQLQERGIPLSAVAKMKPWLISSFVALPTCELQRKSAGAQFLDEKLTGDAIHDGKKVVGLETMVEQIEAMASVSMKTHIAGLVSILKDPQRTKDLMETMIELYADGTPAMIGPLGEYIDKQDTDGTGIAEFEQKMIVIRNHHMAERAQATLAAGNAFMAVGALHLSGPEGLVSLLREQGFTVTPANAVN